MSDRATQAKIPSSAATMLRSQQPFSADFPDASSGPFRSAPSKDGPSHIWGACNPQ